MRLASIFFILIIPLSACANSAANCESPKNTTETRECSVISLDIAKKNLKLIEKTIEVKLINFSGKEHSSSFIKLQKQWNTFIENQCQHKRELFGRGSFSGISYISCKEAYTLKRIESLKETYSVVILS